MPDVPPILTVPSLPLARTASGAGGVRLLTLTGPGGVGKTRLAIAAASGAGDDFPDGVAFINLAPIRHPDLVLDTISAALGLRDMGAASPRDEGVFHDFMMLNALAESNAIRLATAQTAKALKRALFAQP